MKRIPWQKWYPRSWRKRYGEEYEQLLQDLESEEPRSWKNELDVAQSGLSMRRIYPSRRRRTFFVVGTIAALILVGVVLGVGITALSPPVLQQTITVNTKCGVHRVSIGPPFVYVSPAGAVTPVGILPIVGTSSKAAATARAQALALARARLVCAKAPPAASIQRIRS